MERPNPNKRYIDISVKVVSAKAKDSDVTSSVIMIYVGESNLGLAKERLAKEPFTDFELISQDFKCSKPKHYEEQLKIHNVLVNKGGAIRLDNAGPKFAVALRTKVAADPSWKVIDVSASNQALQSFTSTGPYYVNCLMTDKEHVHGKLEEFLQEYHKQHGATSITIAAVRRQDDRTQFSPNNTVESPGAKSKFQFLLSEQTYQDNDFKSVAEPMLPHPLSYTIDTTKKTFADVLKTSPSNN